MLAANSEPGAVKFNNSFVNSFDYCKLEPSAVGLACPLSEVKLIEKVAANMENSGDESNIKSAEKYSKTMMSLELKKLLMD
jgi:hypothetical protein